MSLKILFTNGELIHVIQNWLDRGNEKSDTQIFWLELLRDVLGLQQPETFIEFEKKVELSHISFIDAYIPSTGIIIEQKSSDVNLDASAKQSDGTYATPFEQAKRYYDWLPASQKGRYIIVCNFRELRIHDMETPKAAPEVILIQNIERERHKLSFIVDKNAGSPKEIREYDSLIKRYVNPKDKYSQRCLNVFCVRIVFLLYVETFPKGNYIVIPKVSSERRRYIPMGFLDDSVMCADSLRIIPDATLYHCVRRMGGRGISVEEDIVTRLFEIYYAQRSSNV